MDQTLGRLKKNCSANVVLFEIQVVIGVLTNINSQTGNTTREISFFL